MGNIDGPKHAKQMLSNARGMVRRVLRWTAGAGYPIAEYNLEWVEVDLTTAIRSLETAARKQQAVERSQRERTRHTSQIRDMETR